ncbi:MAG: flagellin [Photobacterium frigidiphilum]|uniref:flagellin N-terminal helical domain-containing protein n=1 Tax=Photobacterium frigidiphilum TaxID=264736 RepID=UPI003003957D
MVLSVNTNTSALISQRYLGKTSKALASSMEKLSTGQRINSAKDDAAGLQISNRLIQQKNGIDVAIRNANDATSMLQTAEGAMAEYTENLMRMRDLTLQYANGSNSSEDRDAIRQEFDALKDELNRITETTSFGGLRLLNGEIRDRTFQIGADAGEGINVQFPNLSENKQQQVESVTRKGLFRTYDESWRSSPRDKLGFYKIDKDYTSTYAFGIAIEPDSSMEDIADQINDELGDNIRAFTETPDSSNRKFNDSKSRFVFYSVDGNKYHPGPSIDIIHHYSRNENDTFFRKNPYTEYGSYGKPLTVEQTTSIITNELPSLNGSSDPESVIDRLDEILQQVDSERAKLGAAQNRLSHAINNLSQTSENVAASNSRIRDTDFARETSRLAKESILKEANTAMLAQAKMAPNAAVDLLQ